MPTAATDRWPALSLPRDEFRRWAQAQAQPGRFERIEGVVVAMAPERASHADRKASASCRLGASSRTEK